MINKIIQYGLYSFIALTMMHVGSVNAAMTQDDCDALTDTLGQDMKLCNEACIEADKPCCNPASEQACTLNNACIPIGARCCPQNEYDCPAKSACIPIEQPCCLATQELCERNNSCIRPGDACCAADEQECNGECIPEENLCILEPWPGMNFPQGMPPPRVGDPLGPFKSYVNNGVWTWVFRMGVAIAILNGVFGAFNIIISNGDSGKVDQGKQRLLWSAIGIVILLLSGVILQFLNPVAFQAL